jgi:hypothetical protein
MLSANEQALPDFAEQAAHRKALAVLQDEGFEPMVGGAYALRTHTGLWRDTKDLDVFLRADRVEDALAALAAAGFRTEFTDRLWIAKAFWDEYFIDLIFSSGNGIATVDELWRERAAICPVLGLQALVVPAEEMIWSKAFIQERERFDGADIHHLLRSKGSELDWEHLLMRFEPHWQVLFVHLVTYRFSFPHDRDQVPAWVMKELTARLSADEEDPAPPGSEKVCRGTLLSRQQYLYETNTLGYRDARELETKNWAGDAAYPVKYPPRPGGRGHAHRRGR